MASDHYWESLAAAEAERAELSDALGAKASALADDVEAAVDRLSVHDWLRTGIYDRTATAFPTEILDLAGFGLDHRNTSPVRVRDALMHAAQTCLETPDK